MKAKTKNSKIWNTHGVSSEDHELCDRAMPLALELVRMAGEFSKSVLEEALFQVNELPKRHYEFQETFKRQARGNELDTRLKEQAPAMAQLLLDLSERVEGYYASAMVHDIDKVLRAAGVLK